MTFGYKALIAATLVAGALGTSAASAMPMSGLNTPVTDSAVHAEKAAVVCIGRCYRRFGGYGYRPAYRAYHPYAFYRARPAYRYYRY